SVGSAQGRRRNANRKPAVAGERSDRFFQFLGSAEGNLLAGLDLDRFAGGRIAAHAGGALAHLQDAETADADAVTLLEVLGHEANQVAEYSLGLLLRHLVGFRKICGDVFQGDGRRRTRLLRCHNWPSSLPTVATQSTCHESALDDSDRV